METINLQKMEGKTTFTGGEAKLLVWHLGIAGEEVEKVEKVELDMTGDEPVITFYGDGKHKKISFEPYEDYDEYGEPIRFVESICDGDLEVHEGFGGLYGKLEDIKDYGLVSNLSQSILRHYCSDKHVSEEDKKKVYDEVIKRFEGKDEDKRRVKTIWCEVMPVYSKDYKSYDLWGSGKVVEKVLINVKDLFGLTVEGVEVPIQEKYMRPY